MRSAVLLTVALLAVPLGTGCGIAKSNPATTGIVKVVAAENFWGDITRQLGGAHVQVRSIISDPTADPHQYESDAGDATAVADSDVVIKNGGGYDDAIAKLLSVSSSRSRVVVSVDEVLHETADGVNPHFWYDLPRVPEVAAAIESALATADPRDQSVFASGLRRFDASLAPLEHALSIIRARYPGAPVAYTERVPGYLLDAAGLTVAGPPGFAQAIEDGNEPNARDTQAMDDLISGRHVRVLLYNAQATSPVTEHVRQLAQDSGVPVVAVTETQPRDAASFQSWQLGQLQALQRALGG
jgi:zinc/manganese transport system substrate-binding protein